MKLPALVPSLALVVLTGCGAPGSAGDAAPRAAHAAESPCDRAARDLTEASTLRELGFLSRALSVAQRANGLCATPSAAALVSSISSDLWMDDAALKRLALDPDAAARARANDALAEGRRREHEMVDLAEHSRAAEAADAARAARTAFQRSFEDWTRPVALLGVADIDDAFGEPVAARIARERALVLAERAAKDHATPVLPGAHSSPVEEIRLSSDGKSALTRADDEVRVWDIATGLDVRRITLPGARAVTLHSKRSIAWIGLASGHVVAHDWDKDVRLFDVALGSSLAGPIAFDAATSTLAVALEDRVVTCDPATGARRIELAWSAKYTTALAANGGVLAAGNESGAVQIWDAATGRVLATLTDGKESVAEIAVSPSGARVAWSEHGGPIRVWSRGARAPTTLQLPASSLSSPWRRQLAFVDDRTLASCDTDTFAHYDVTKGIITSLARSAARVSEIASFDGEGRRAVAVAPGPDGKFAVYDAVTAQRLDAFGSTLEGIVQVRFDPSGSWLAASSGAGVYVWSPLGDVRGVAKPDVRTLEWTGRNASLLIDSHGFLNGSQSVTTYDVLAGIRGGASAIPPGARVALSRSQIAVADATGIVVARADGSDVRRVPLAETVQLAISGDGSWIAARGRDGVLRLADVSRRTPPRDLGRLRPLTDGAPVFSPDGRFVASPDGIALVDRAGALIWRVSDGAEVAHPRVGLVSSLAFDAAGEHLFAGGLHSNAVTVVEVANPGSARRLDAHAGGVLSLDIHPSGRLLAAGTTDGVVKLLDLASGNVIATLASSMPVYEELPMIRNLFNDALKKPRREDDRAAPDWVILTSDGQVDGSPGGRRMLRWKVGGDVFPGALAWARGETGGLFSSLLAAYQR